MPTRSSSSPARTSARRLSMRSCARSVSTNWSPTRISGLSEFIAPWKTIETFRQRNRRSSSVLRREDVLAAEEDAAADDVPGRAQDAQHRARDGRLAAAGLAGEPEDLALADLQVDAVDGAGASVVDLRPRTSSSVSTPSCTAAGVSVSSAITQCPCSGRSGGGASSHPLRAQARVADLVDAGEDQHEPEDGEGERGAREEERPPLALQDGGVRLRPVERRAPARRRRVAEPEELEAGVDQQRDVEDEHESRRDPADHVRHQLGEDDPRARLARGPCGRHEVAVLQRQRLAPQDARLERPEHDGEDDDHRSHPARVQVAREDDQERNRRDDEEDVGQEVDALVPQAARRRRR